MVKNSLDNDVKRAINEGKFLAFARSYIELKKDTDSTEREKNLNELGLTTYGFIEDSRYAKAEKMYGSREGFKMHRTVILSSNEMLPVNLAIQEQIEPYRQALKQLSNYNINLEGN